MSCVVMALATRSQLLGDFWHIKLDPLFKLPVGWIVVDRGCISFALFFVFKESWNKGFNMLTSQFPKESLITSGYAVWVVFFFLGSLLIGLCIINSSILDRFLEVDFFFLQWDSWHFMTIWTIYCTLPETNRHRPGKYPGKGDSYWKPPLLGDIVVSGRDIFYYHRNMFLTIQLAIFQVQRTLQNAFSPHPCC